MESDVVGDFLNELLILTFLSLQHGLPYGCHDFLLIKADSSAVSFQDCLDHIGSIFSFGRALVPPYYNECIKK